MGSIDWINMDLDMDKRTVVIKVVMKLRVP